MTLGSPQRSADADLPPLSGAARRFGRTAHGPLLWAHRGASHDAPENTMDAFALAVEQGADGIELDVRRCASGEVVVFHDDALRRVTGEPGRIESSRWSRLRGLDAGAWKGSGHPHARIPLLAEVLSSTPAELLVNIELKCGTLADGGLVAAVLDTVRDQRAGERVLLSCFQPLALLRARLLAPELPRALLFHRTARRAEWSIPLGTCALHPAEELIDAAFVRRWRAAGRAVNAWTVDDASRAAGLSRAGVDGIITNRPRALREELGRDGALSLR